jgi:hypothetical protein
MLTAAGAPSCGSSGDGSAFDAGDSDGTAGGDGGAGASCEAGQASCGASCVDVTSDPKNCGTCGTSCGTGLCCSGVCNADTASCGFSVTRITPKQGNQSGGDYLTLEGNGFVTGMKVLIGDGVAPARMIDAHKAIVQTPPGPVGDEDITISSGATKATYKAGFRYVAAGMQLPWQEKPMAFVRGEDPGLAVLQDGRVLVVGGTTVPDSAANTLDSAEIYTRSSDTVANAKGPMAIKRWHSSAITMLTGKVLIVGGAGASDVAELFDPKTETFTPTKTKLLTARGYTRSVLMVDGRVMVSSSDGAGTEVYDPDADGFTAVPAAAAHVFGFMVRLRDGRVMLGGGDGGNNMVELFDGTQWKTVAPLAQGRSMLTAHTLPDGRVMVVGGASVTAGGVDVPLDSIELYDPKADKWTTAPYKLSRGRTWHASALVRDGTVIVMGGYTIDKSCTPDDSVDQVDPIAGTSKPFGKLPRPNCEWTAVTLPDGSVLGVGGGACGASTANPSLDFLPGVPLPK